MNIYFVIKYHADLANKNLIERICHVAEINHQITCGHRNLEKWGRVSFTPDALMQQVFEKIENSDALLIEFSEGGIGMGIEAGYAKAKNIPVYVMQPKGTVLGSSALRGVCNAWFEYETDDDIQNIIETIAKEQTIKTINP